MTVAAPAVVAVVCDLIAALVCIIEAECELESVCEVVIVVRISLSMYSALAGNDAPVRIIAAVERQATDLLSRSCFFM